MKKNDDSQYRNIILIIYYLICILTAQTYIPADPFNLLFTEKNIFLENKKPGSLIIRPLFEPVESNSMWLLKVRNEFFYNNDVPNLENMSDRWVGKGAGYFSSINLSYVDKYFSLSIEPYYFINQNDDYKEPQRLPKFSRLNDNRPHTSSPYIAYGVRELQIYAKFKGIGAGFSNANMWWGSGIHSSIMMTNNTSGFGYAFLGTLSETMYKNIGINARYIFSKLDKKSLYKPYYSAFAISISYYLDNIYTIGITKTALTGGSHPTADKVTWQDAALAIFGSGLIPDSWNVDDYRENWSTDDHAAAGYFSVDIKRSMLKLFFGIGRNDIVWDPLQLLVYPDHAIAINIGMRKYKIFQFEQLFFGIEYTNLMLPRLSHLLAPGDWYARDQYDYNSYDGRRWVAHSGSDSDDLLIIFGWLDDTITILPSFNYERHGLRQPTSIAETNLILDQINDIWTETKLEFRLDLRYKYKAYKLNLYFEREVTLNLESKDKTQKGFVVWIGIEREFDKVTLEGLYNMVKIKK